MGWEKEWCYDKCRDIQESLWAGFHASHETCISRCNGIYDRDMKWCKKTFYSSSPGTDDNEDSHYIHPTSSDLISF